MPNEQRDRGEREYRKVKARRKQGQNSERSRRQSSENRQAMIYLHLDMFCTLGASTLSLFSAAHGSIHETPVLAARGSIHETPVLAAHGSIHESPVLAARGPNHVGELGKHEHKTRNF